MMPSPEELEKIQKENLTDEQIGKDKIREEAFNAGYEKYPREEEKRIEDLRVYLEKCKGRAVRIHFKNSAGVYRDGIVKDIYNTTLTLASKKHSDIDFLNKKYDIRDIEDISHLDVHGI